MAEKYYEIKTNKGTLRGMKHIPSEIKGVLIMYHGYTGTNVEPRYLFTYMAREIEKLGYVVIRMDYLGCGNSDGYFKDQTFGVFLDNAKTIYEEAVKEYPSVPVNILGLSMGGAIATEMTKYYDIQKVILMSPAISMKEKMNLWKGSYDIKGELIDVDGMYMNVEFINEIDKYNFYQKQDTKASVLVFAPTLDDTILYEEVQEYKRVYQNLTFIPVEGSDHVFSKVKYRELMNSEIKKFLI